MQEPLVFKESISFTFDLDDIEQDIARTLREIVLQITDEEVNRMTRARFPLAPQKSDSHAVCVRYGITWGDFAAELVRQGRTWNGPAAKALGKGRPATIGKALGEGGPALLAARGGPVKGGQARAA
jgi:hypothetical protein